MNPLDHEDELLDRARREGPQVLSPVVRHYQRGIATVLRRILGSAAPIEDLTHDVFLRAFSSLDRFDGRGPLGPWLLRVAHNLAVDHLRRQGRWALPMGESVEALGEALGEELSPPGAALEEVERGRLLGQALEELSPHHRMVLLYQFYLDLDTARISEITGWTAKRIQNLSCYARSRMREILSRLL